MKNAPRPLLTPKTREPWQREADAWYGAAEVAAHRPQSVLFGLPLHCRRVRGSGPTKFSDTC